MRAFRLILSISLLTTLIWSPGGAGTQAPAFTIHQVMIPMRDGIQLQTVILAPSDAAEPLPILFRRTPYGVPANADITSGASYKELMRDGYIFVIQNLRGRFQSEGIFELSSKVNLQDPKSINEATDDRKSV